MSSSRTSSEQEAKLSYQAEAHFRLVHYVSADFPHQMGSALVVCVEPQTLVYPCLLVQKCQPRDEPNLTVVRLAHCVPIAATCRGAPRQASTRGEVEAIALSSGSLAGGLIRVRIMSSV